MRKLVVVSSLIAALGFAICAAWPIAAAAQPDALALDCERRPTEAHARVKRVRVTNRSAHVVKAGSLLTIDTSDGDRIVVAPLAFDLGNRDGANTFEAPGSKSDPGSFTCTARATAPGKWTEN